MNKSHWLVQYLLRNCKNCPVLGALSPNPLASSGWRLYPQHPAAEGITPRLPMASGGWELFPQNSSIVNSWL